MKYLIAVCLLLIPAVALSEGSPNSTPPEYLHIFLGEAELRIPNVAGVNLSGPNAPERGEYFGGFDERVLSDGTTHRFYPFLGEQPYYARSIFLTKSGGSNQGLYEILRSQGDLELLKGITGILFTQPKPAGADWPHKKSFEDIALAPSPYQGFYYRGKNRTTVESFVTNDLHLFGVYVRINCSSFTPSEPEGRWCHLYGRMPGDGSIRLSIKLNYSHSDSWENLDAALEAWPARLRALERLLLSFYVSPNPDD